MEQRKIPDHIETPEGIRLGISQVDKRRLGSFCTTPIAKGAEFGPYKGKIVFDKHDDTVDPKFSWKVFDLVTFKYLHTVDASCPADGNWMRYVCCARYFEEQNIVSTQNGTDVYYRALKDIEAGEELLTWFEQKKRKRKRSSVRNSLEADEMPHVSSSNSLQALSMETPPQSPGKVKRRRKPKIIPDAYDGPLDWEEQDQKVKKTIKEEEFEPLQPGQKRRRRKKPSCDNLDTNVAQELPKLVGDSVDQKSDGKSESCDVFEEKDDKENDIDGGICEDSDSKNASFNSEASLTNSSEGKKETSHMSIAEINNSVEWEFPKSGEEYNFELKKHHTVKDNGKKVYQCDICLGLYKHMFSLKRHYLRNHINYKYISKSDMTNCLINLMQAKQQMKYKLAALADEKTFKRKPEVKNHVAEIPKNVNDIDRVAEEIDLKINEDKDKVEDIKDDKLSTDELPEKSETVSEETKCQLSESIKTENDVKLSAHDVDSIDGIKEDNTKSSEDHCQDNLIKMEEDTKKEESNRDDAVKIADVNNELKHDKESRDASVEPDSEIDAKSHIVLDSEIDAKSHVVLDSEIDAKSHVVLDSEIDAKSHVVLDSEIDAKSHVVLDEVQNKTPMPGLFRCYTCYLTFDDFEGIREHTQNHPEQMEGECFPCDLCSMRFNYKHNLIRHKKTHNSGDGISSSSSIVTSTEQGEGQEKLSPRKHLLPFKAKPAADKKPGLLPTVFRCGVCPQKFDTQQAVVKHVEEEHKIGSKCQCIYCGKDFLSMPNMKKHVRFHLGYRATCRICSEAFSNVGALRKHTRVVHPEDYRAKLIERLQKYGVLKGPDKNALSKEVIDKINLDQKNLKAADPPKEPVEIVKKEKVRSGSNTPLHEKEEDIENEINFTADEIDDGGSRFKFACTVCKKRFSSYINMCRHRRKVHSHENRHRTVECLTFGRKPRVNPSPILENPLDVAAFFANISHNIATNLNCYIDGKSESLKTFADHIKVEDYKGSFGYSAESELNVNFSWNKYNFPQGFKPGETISYADIKNVLNIHNDFDSHCTSAADERSVIAEDIKESEEDSEVRKINSLQENSDSELEEMKTSSHGFKVLGNVGSVLSRKGTTAMNKGINSDDAKHVNVRITGGVIYATESPAAKTFHQIERGEYANFQDDMMVDMDSPLAVRSQSVSSSKSWKRTQSSDNDEDRLSPSVSTKSLVKSAQEELDSLYGSIDSMEPVQTVGKQTPKSLSSLCEEVLGLCTLPKEKRNCSLTNEVASHLKLSTKEDIKNGPDFSDVPEESPFYNYDTIMFGRNGQIEQICAICRRHFSDIDHLMRHHMKKHPASVCSFLEVENGHEIEDLHFSQPCHVGALAVTNPGLDDMSDLTAFRCTNCDSSFPSMSKLHIHILNCSSIDPLYGSEKSDKSPGKTTFRKRFQKKIFSMFGSSKNFRRDLSDNRFNHLDASSRCPKRVFMGCRKRKSVILPDSPVKTSIDPKHLLPTGSGYNPQNHVRRREFTEVLNNLMCEACGQQFKTIIILERHVKHCDKKEKFKNVQPMACPLDEYLEKKKNMCLYCNKNFTYTKSLLNHFQDFCPVKKAKLDKGDLTELEKKKEEEVIERIHKGDEEKALKQKEMENRPKRKISWQVGRKSKRKGHSWTNIKKRNQLKAMKGSTEGSEDMDEDGDDNDEGDENSSESEDEIDNNVISSGSSEITAYKKNGNDENASEPGVISNMDKEYQKSNEDELRPVVKDLEMKSSAKIEECCEDELVTKLEANNHSACDSTVKPLVDTTERNIHSNVDHLTEKSRNDSHEYCDSAEMEACELEGTHEAEDTHEEPVETTDDPSHNDEISDNAFSENESQLNSYSVGNTSLNCTARYKVYNVQPAKKYRPIRPKPALFQCISGKLSNNTAPAGKTCPAAIAPKPSMISSVTTFSSTSQDTVVRQEQVVEQLSENKSETVDSKEITGKRKRKQVGKVEEFLKALRKKNKKKSENSSESENGGQSVDSAGFTNESESVETESKGKQPSEIEDVVKNNDSEARNEDVISNSSTDDLDNSGFVSFDIPAGTTPPSVVRKRGRPRKEHKGVPSSKRLGRPPKLFPSIKSTGVSNMLKRKVGRPPKLKPVEGLSIKKLSECEGLIPDVMTNPALTFTHLMKNGEMKYCSGDKDRYSDEEIAEKVTESSKTNYSNSCSGISDNDENVHKCEINCNKELSEFSLKPDDNYLNNEDQTNEDGDLNDEAADNCSDPSTEPFSESVAEFDDIYEDMPNLELVSNIDELECQNDKEDTENDQNSCSEETDVDFNDCNTGGEKLDEIDGNIKPNEYTATGVSGKYASESEFKSESKDEQFETEEIISNLAEGTESEENPESDYKTESEFENMTEEEDICEGKRVDQTEDLNNVVNESSSELEDDAKHSEKEEFAKYEETMDNFEGFGKFEPILSPSERVKMNKRSCKKDVELTSPVWMKRTKLYKGKLEKKNEDPNKVSDTTSDSDGSCKSHEVNNKDKAIVNADSKASADVTTSKSALNDGHHNKGRKRKGLDPDETEFNKSKLQKREMKACTKKTVKGKK